MRRIRTAIVLSALLAPAAAYAQGKGHAHAATNGGQIQQIGSYEGELVVKGADVMLYVVDETEQKVDASKLSATAVVLAKGNEQKTVELKPAKDNVLSGKADFPVDGKFRATVTLKSGAAEVGKGRYSLDVTAR
jgi:nitrogen fixation protein FixH